MKRVMIVDSHRQVRDVLTELLRAELDLAVAATCADGYEAIHVAQQARPDVILIDPQLPREDGVAVIRQLAAMHPEARVLILTAAPHDRLVARATAAGAQEVLSKSAPYTTILAAIRAATDDARGQPG
jgi:DNA-binding NarL/FixJ family response regulator